MISTRASTPSPYQDLYIYHLEGNLARNTIIHDDRFLGNWEEDRFSFLFFTEPSEDAVNALLKSQQHLALLDRFQLPYQKWQGNEPLPFRIGRLNITFPWIETKQQVNCSPPIVLDPGVVFGSGNHPTTRDCLNALDFLLCEERVESAIDLGTGSGILALGAARLGVDKIIAIDNNPLSVITAGKNVAANKMEGTILVVRGRAEDFIDCASDLVIANIHFDVMKRILQSEGFFQKKWFILSGLLKSEARAVVDGLFSHHAEIIKSWIHEGIWHTYLGKNGPKSFQFHFNKGKG